MTYYCDWRLFDVTCIEWVNDESDESKLSAPPNLPSELRNWSVRGYPHWSDSDWIAACIEQIEDIHNWHIRRADVKRCENEQ